LPELKLNLKFEIEVLCKALELSLDDIQPSTLLRGRPGHFTEHDFRPSAALSAPVRAAMAQTANGGGGVADTSSSAAAAAAAVAAAAASSSHAIVLAAAASAALAGAASAGGAPGAPGAASGEFARLVTVNTALLAQQPALRHAVPLAIDRAVQEIVGPVVERAVSISTITTRELVTKDFATEANAIRLRRAAHLMVQNLAGSLAAVTCKEPLRIAIGSHLRALLAAGCVARVYVVRVCCA
jgi:CCR4-NOT transcription complex subunit 1